MNTNTVTSNFNLSQSFSWLPPFHEKAIELGAFLRKKYTNAQMSDDTEKLKKGDIYILNAGTNFSTRALLLLVKEKDPVVVVADTSEKKIIEDWCSENIKSDKRNWKKTYFITSLRTLSGFLASSFYLNPSEKIIISAVTGTNGKTTVVNAAANAFANCEGTCASLGTLGLIIYKKVLNRVKENRILEFGMTTPSAVFLQRYLQLLLDQGVTRLILEASSIGLVQGRLLGCKIKHAILTNIGHDHLDFHGNFKELQESKILLFKAPDLDKAIFVKSNISSFNISKRIEKIVKPQTGPYFVSASDQKIQSDVNLKIHSTLKGGTNISFECKSKCIERFIIPTIGTHNIENAAVVAGLLSVEKKNLKDIISALKHFKSPRGRMDFHEDINCPLVCIDYAHTPDALKQILSTLNLLLNKKKGKLICVFGCGGDRDQSKRPLMGEIASHYCDRGFITSDNPRTENIISINEQILVGINKTLRAKWNLFENRSKAIREAILTASVDDIVLIAGKGHENYQIIKTKKLFFSDENEVKLAFEQRKHELDVQKK